MITSSNFLHARFQTEASEGGHGTINPAGTFNVEDDALMLRRAAVDGSGNSACRMQII